MLHAFISYARLNNDWVDGFEQALRDRGVPIWIDRRDLPVSVPWSEDIEYAISGALVFVVCSSDEWDQSKNCALEAESAERQLVPTIVVSVQDAPEVSADAVRAGGDQERAHGTLRAQLARRALDWQKSGRKRGFLSSGRWLRDANKRVRRGGIPVSPLATEYLHHSVRRDRRRRITARIGSLTIVTIIALGYGLNALAKHENKLLVDSATAALEVNQLTALIDTAPYAALRELAPRAVEGGDGFQFRDRLMRALTVPLPTTSSPVTATDRRELNQHCNAKRNCVSAPQDGLSARWAWRTGVVTVFSPDGAVLRRITVNSGTRALQLSPDGRFIAVGRAFSVRIFSVSSGTLVVELEGSDSVVRGVRWSPDGEHITALTDTRRNEWDWRPVAVLAQIDGAWFVSLSPPDARGAVVGATRDGQLVSAAAGRGARKLASFDGTGEVLAAPFTPSGSKVLLVADKQLVVASRDGQLLHEAPNSCGATTAAIGDEQTAWLACADGKLAEVTLDTLAVTRRIAQPDTGVLSIVARHTGLFITDLINGVWVITPGNAPSQIAGRPCGAVRAIAVAPKEDTWIAVGDGVGKVPCTIAGFGSGEKWRLGGYLAPRRPGEQSRAVAFSPSGDIAAVGYSDGTVATFTWPSETPGWMWLGTPGSVRALRFSADGTTLYAATRDGAITAMPACPGCASSTAMARYARQRVAHGRALGLVK